MTTVVAGWSRIPAILNFPDAARFAETYGFGAASSRAQSRTIAGKDGNEIHLRVIAPPQPRGIYLHLHGGGWVLGGADMQDPMLEGIADNTNQVVVGVDYRLAPEHPYPAGPGDCEAAAAWLVENGKREFGTEVLTIGGESAGGHLTAVTILRMRDRHGYTGFRGANIVYGAFDLSLTPSQRLFGNTRLVLRTIDMQQFYNAFLPTITDRRVPDISPLYGDLKGLCPALFSVGTKDALLDDTLFMHARWVAAGNDAELGNLSRWCARLHIISKRFVEGGDRANGCVPEPRSQLKSSRIFRLIVSRYAARARWRAAALTMSAPFRHNPQKPRRNRDFFVRAN